MTVSTGPPPERPPDDLAPLRFPTRRGFVGAGARRAMYVAPVILSLAPLTAMAGASACGQTGSVCYSDVDCCGGWTCLDMGRPVTMGETGTCE